ncbi:MAG TPA: mechanosensitive ion channel family protein, partial [Chitinophagaceae bacterium]|nr:mechanosensitive ion channel family protein [Chitinophagaceae bacterium]
MRYYFLQTELTKNGISWINKISDFVIAYAPKLLGAILFYIIGSWIIGRIGNLTKKLFTKRHYDPSLQSFLVSLIKIVLTILLVISIFGILGVDTTAFAALVVGAGIAIGSALNGTLGNFAGGVMMLIFKPFKIGDLIEAQQVIGTVTEQGVFVTTVLTPDNKTVIIPNGPLSTGIITNYTTHGNLRVDLQIAIPTTESIDKARQVAIAAMESHPDVLKDPAPGVSVLKTEPGIITLAIQPYTTQAKYWDVYFG